MCGGRNDGQVGQEWVGNSKVDLRKSSSVYKMSTDITTTDYVVDLTLSRSYLQTVSLLSYLLTELRSPTHVLVETPLDRFNWPGREIPSLWMVGITWSNVKEEIVQTERLSWHSWSSRPGRLSGVIGWIGDRVTNIVLLIYPEGLRTVKTGNRVKDDEGRGV